METFYQDKESVFKCKVVIDGASLSDSSARLVLKFGSISYLFYGKLDSSGKCKVKVPALKNCPSDDGEAILEIIADSMFFEPYSTKFIVKKSKSVTVERDEDEDDDEDKIVKPKVKVIKEEQVKEETKIGFNDFYTRFKKLRLQESKGYANYKPSNAAFKIVNEQAKGKLNNEVSKIFMFYLDNIVL